ncbi:MAG: hypothetical protein U0105_03195 [Candidatus Obscuribacterales bacterium]
MKLAASVLRELFASRAQTGCTLSVAQVRFWKALCDDYAVPFSLPLSDQSKRLMVTKLLLQNEPVLAKYSKHGEMGGAALTGLLHGLIVKHVFPIAESPRRGRPPGSANSERRLRAKALINIEKAKGGTLNDAVRLVLARNPDLSPSQRLSSDNSPESATYSQYRKDRKDAENREDARKGEESAKLQAFLSTLSSEHKAWVIRLFELSADIGDHCGGSPKVRAEMIRELFSVFANVLPEGSLSELLRIFFRVDQADQIVGEALQAIAERLRAQTDAQETTLYGRD